MNLCIVFDRECEALPTLPFGATDSVQWIPGDPGFERNLGCHRPAIVVLDLRRRSAETADCVARVRLAVPCARVLVVGAAHDVDAADAALRAGAVGYVTRPINLGPALRALRNESVFVSSTGARAMSRSLLAGATKE